MIKEKVHRKSMPGAKIYWESADGSSFVDTEIEFRQTISPLDKMDILKHFILGFERYEAQNEYAIATMDFIEPNLLKMTIQFLDVPRSKALLALVVELQGKYPIKRWNHIIYPEKES